MWLPFPAATVFDPRSRRLARLLEAPLYAALGILAGLWAQALEYAPSGILDGETLADLLAALGADPGPTRAALERAGWLVTRDDGYVELVGWDRLGGRLLEAREKHRARQARYRARRATGDGDRRVMVTRRSRDTQEYRRVQQKDQNRLDQIRLDEASPPSDYAAADSPTPQGNSAGGALMFSLARPLTAPAPLGDGEAREDRADAVMPTDAELDALYERGVEFFGLRNAKAETEWLLSHRDQWDRWLAIAKGLCASGADPARALGDEGSSLVEAVEHAATVLEAFSAAAQRPVRPDEERALVELTCRVLEPDVVLRAIDIAARETSPEKLNPNFVAAIARRLARAAGTWGET